MNEIIWTPEMDAELSRMAHAGYGHGPVAERLGVSWCVARVRRKVLGLPKGRSGGPERKFDHAAAVRAYQAGVGLSELAERFGVSAVAIWQAVNRAGVPLHHPRKSNRSRPTPPRESA